MNFIAYSETIFRQILAASLSASILLAIVWAIQRLCGKRLGPDWRHALWLLVLIRLLVPVLPESQWSLFNAPQWFRSKAAAPQIPVTLLEPASQKFEAAAWEQPGAAEPPIAALLVEEKSLTWFQIAALAWLAISVLLLLRLAAGSFWLRLRLHKTAKPASPPVLQALRESRWRMRARSNPRLLETSCVDSPGLFGCWRPKLLLPAGITSHLTETELRHIFMHELAHLQRGDLWTNFAMTVAHAVHWFNPMVWLLLRRLRLERELACDAIALKLNRPEERRSYGETILKLLERVSARPAFPALVGIMEEKQAARSRLTQVASFVETGRSSRVLGSLMLACLGFFGLSNGQTEEQLVPSTGSATEPSPQRSPALHGIRVLEQEYARQKQDVEKQQRKVDALRKTLNISEAEVPDRIERDLTVAVVRHAAEKRLADELKKRSRAELRKLIPSVAPDAAMDRYLGDLAKAEQEYASAVSDLGPEHPRIVNLVTLIKTINQQIENRIDGVLAGLDLQISQNDALVKELTKLQDKAEQSSQVWAPYFAARRELENQQRILDTIYMRLLAEKVDAQLSVNSREAADRAAPTNTPKSQSADLPTLMQDAKLLYKLGRDEEAKDKLRQALDRQLDPGALPARPAAPRIYTNLHRAEILQTLQDTRIPEFQLSARTLLRDALQQLHRQMLAHDPDKRVDFMLSSSETLLNPVTGEERASGSVEKFIIPTRLTLSNLSAFEVLLRLAEFARPPEQTSIARGVLPAANPIAFSIEDYGVVFKLQTSQAAPPLYTRTYKLDPATLARNLPKAREDDSGRTPGLMERLRLYLVGVGLEFAARPASTPGAAASSPGQREKAIFYNDKTGVFFARATLADLDIIETALQDLNSVPPDEPVEPPR